jgi:hypothetical protein
MSKKVAGYSSARTARAVPRPLDLSSHHHTNEVLIEGIELVISRS